MNSHTDPLLLENQICFPLYALSRAVTKAYTPHLEPLGLTYPQYLVLLALWEHKRLLVNRLGALLHLESNTLTPLLKRMEAKNLLTRQRDSKDERQVWIQLTQEGKNLRAQALCIPEKLMEELLAQSSVSTAEALQFKEILTKLLGDHSNRFSE